MNVCPGLIGDVAGGTSRIFLGAKPNLVVENRLVHHMQPVYAWYASRKRTKEQASEFVELDGSSIDNELFFRHSHAFFTRQQLHAATLEKQLQLLESGKLPKEAQPGALKCLEECMEGMKQRLAFEEKKLLHAKRTSKRELEPNSAIDPWDVPVMMRRVEEEESEMPDAESRAKAFLPATVVQEAATSLLKTIVPTEHIRTSALEKKDVKLINKHLSSTSDYKKIGSVDKMRPLDVSAYYRFYGERVTTPIGDNNFANLLWGNLFRRVAAHPEYLMHVSKYWSSVSGVSKNVRQSQMLPDVAMAVGVQQTCLPALRFKLQHMYTNAEFGKQVWRNDWFVPLLRLHPLLGHGVAEDMLASTLVDGLWKRLDLAPTTNPLSEEVIMEMRGFVADTAALRAANPDVLFSNVIEAVKTTVPSQLTEAEKKWVADYDSGRLNPQAASAADEFSQEYEEIIVIEEGIPETGAIPNETLEPRK